MTCEDLGLTTTSALVDLIAARLVGFGFHPAPWIGPLYGHNESGQVAVYGRGHYSLDITETSWEGADQSWPARSRRGASTVTSRVSVRWLRHLRIDQGHVGYKAALDHEQRVISALVSPVPPSTARVRVARATRSVLQEGWVMVEVSLEVDHPYRLLPHPDPE